MKERLLNFVNNKEKFTSLFTLQYFLSDPFILNFKIFHQNIQNPKLAHEQISFSFVPNIFLNFQILLYFDLFLIFSESSQIK